MRNVEDSKQLENNYFGTHTAGTHEVQNIDIHQGQKSDVIITSEFINESRATGIFAIAYSLREDSNVHYTIGTQLQSQWRTVARLMGVPGHTYNISVFALLRDGLPFTRAAALPKLVTTSKLKGKQLFPSPTNQDMGYL